MASSQAFVTPAAYPQHLGSGYSPQDDLGNKPLPLHCALVVEFVPTRAYSRQKPASGMQLQRTLDNGEVTPWFPFRLGALVREIGDRDVSGVFSLSHSSLSTLEQWLSSTPPPECLVYGFLP